MFSILFSFTKPARVRMSEEYFLRLIGAIF